MSYFEFEFSCRLLKSILEFDFSNSRSRILKSNFEFDFFVSLLYSISRISIFDSNLSSKFSMSCSIRLLEFQFSIRVSSSSSLNFRVEFRIRLFRFVALFDFSNLDVDSNLSSKFSMSCSIRLLEFRCSIRFLEFRCSIRFLEFRFEIRLLDSSVLISRVRICRRISNSS